MVEKAAQFAVISFSGGLCWSGLSSVGSRSHFLGAHTETPWRRDAVVAWLDTLMARLPPKLTSKATCYVVQGGATVSSSEPECGPPCGRVARSRPSTGVKMGWVARYVLRVYSATRANGLGRLLLENAAFAPPTNHLEEGANHPTDASWRARLPASNIELMGSDGGMRKIFFSSFVCAKV